MVAGHKGNAGCSPRLTDDEMYNELKIVSARSLQRKLNEVSVFVEEFWRFVARALEYTLKVKLPTVDISIVIFLFFRTETIL